MDEVIVKGPMSPEMWAHTALRVVELLGKSLGCELLVHEDCSMYFADGFSVDVRSPAIGRSPWHFGVRAVLGGEEIDKQPYIRAWVFFYFADRRIEEHNGEYLEMQFNLQASNWDVVGWDRGEPGEFDGFRHFERV
jgi:hypothetical protein